MTLRSATTLRQTVNHRVIGFASMRLRFLSNLRSCVGHAWARFAKHLATESIMTTTQRRRKEPEQNGWTENEKPSEKVQVCKSALKNTPTRKGKLRVAKSSYLPTERSWLHNLPSCRPRWTRRHSEGLAR